MGVVLGEVVLVLEGVDWEDEGVDWEGEDVNDYLVYVLLLMFEDEN